MARKTLAALALVTAATFVGGWALVGPVLADDKLPSKSDQSCLKCHEYDKASNLFAGKLVEVSSKANALQLQIDKGMEVIYFDDSTVLKNAPSMKEIPKQESIRITYFKKDGKTFAKEIEVKKGIAVPKEKLADVEEVAKLVALGPEKGKYVLLDSRPVEGYDQGHIPTAVSMPFFAFDKLQETLLPKDKEVLQIYYCIGFS
ncbi:MAG: rhodanese-like domain-containing protein [Desulfomonile tiedjei]|nr:rhodanese-like domain-containing protein [Desulfomonile tiedjei]